MAVRFALCSTCTYKIRQDEEEGWWEHWPEPGHPANVTLACNLDDDHEAEPLEVLV